MLQRKLRQPVALICILLVILGLYYSNIRWSGRTQSSDPRLHTSFVKTHKGSFSYAELEEAVFRPLGYRIREARPVIPSLEFVSEPTCHQAFNEYVETSKNDTNGIPPARIPDKLLSSFDLNGYSFISYRYSNDKSAGGPIMWSDMKSWLAKSDRDLEYAGYSGFSASLNSAMSHFGVASKTGLIVGSLSPWAETMALKLGAKKVVTVEYSKISIDETMRERMEAVLAPTLAENWQKYAGQFDFAASFSSIEHSGLGRFGDPLDPIGDFREMTKVRCLLKPGGLFYFAVPYGLDGIVFNLHRIYGPVRLAFMFAGFEWVTTFVKESKLPVNLTAADFDLPHPNEIQKTIVLRKI
ncbi:unnamed protein product [Caenorhabditis auriculariae]|uniref:DUF268 domain-containing protein n=1 Tax=Caenorhabditis auriculariae TaxID=2777116 RepID=A0A8S1GN39_9PELO|nr:unnamed protein product [Caenorhabditis auriculariae]